MKKISIYLAVMIIALSLSGCDKAQEDNTVEEDSKTEISIPDSTKYYENESGILEYELGGDWTGTQMIYFDDYGMKNAQTIEATMNSFGLTMDINTLNVFKDGWTYSIDYTTQSGTKLKDEILAEILTDEANAENLGAVEIMKALGATQQGTDTHLGKECDLWVMEELGTTTCMWNGIVMYMNLDLMGVVTTTTLVDMQLDIPVGDEYFELPEDIEIVDDQNVEEMAEGMDTMKDYFDIE